MIPVGSSARRPLRIDRSARARTPKGPPDAGGPFVTSQATQMALTSRGMPGPNVVDTAPFWM
jgi:hypothetical protein